MQDITITCFVSRVVHELRTTVTYQLKMTTADGDEIAITKENQTGAILQFCKKWAIPVREITN